eukprot:3633648-Alexandrium_andersonii.AAC.1
MRSSAPSGANSSWRSPSWSELATVWNSGASSFANMRRRSSRIAQREYETRWAYPRRCKNAAELRGRLPQRE